MGREITHGNGCPLKNKQKRPGRYHIITRNVGEGSFSSVDIAKNVKRGTRSRSLSAIKQFYVSALERTQCVVYSRNESVEIFSGVFQLEREVAILKKCGGRSAYVVDLEDVMRTENRITLAFEYRGNPIMDFVEDANAYSALTLDPVTGLLFRPKLKHDIDVFTEDECINCFKQLLQGMSFLRREGVVHKDIKPENVLINYPVCQWRRFLNNTPHDMQSTWKHDRALQVTICDFNTAELVPDGRLYDAQGTVLFTPPEAFDFIDTDVGIDAYARDAWSVGMVGYYMLAGCNPIPNYASALEYQLTLIGMHHENRRIRIPDEIAPKNEIIREVIEDLLHPHPESRMTVDRALSILQ